MHADKVEHVFCACGYVRVPVGIHVQLHFYLNSLAYSLSHKSPFCWAEEVGHTVI